MIEVSEAPPLEWTRLGGNSWVSTDGRYFVAPAGFGAYVAHRRQQPHAIELGTCADEAAAKAMCQGDAQ